MDVDSWLRLSRAGLLARRWLNLLEQMGSAQAILRAGRDALLAVEGVTARDHDKIERAKAEADVEADKAKLEQMGAHLLTIQDEAYPHWLKEIYDPPPLLYVRGEMERRDEQAVAIVGTRNCSNYGVVQAGRLAADLARRGFTIISGLARGIDAAAHEGALDAGGRSIGVAACGLEVDYPKGHAELKDRLAESGALLSELPLGTRPDRGRFPQRNRIVSGLALGVVVVEAPGKSGALITAGLALDQGREVFALPGDVTNPRNRGCHRLIKDGAALVETAEDVVEGLGIMLEAAPTREEAPRPQVELTEDEAKIVGVLSFQPRHVDDVIRETELPPAQVTASLMMLEVKGLVRRFPGSTFVRL
ncbi:MAG: DNA-processing protein DprA [Armatimonadota bacterium]